MQADPVSLDEALVLIAAHPLARTTERIPLGECDGRRLAQQVAAPFDRPTHAVSAMDGYAVRLADVGTAGAKLRVIGEAPAGTTFDGIVGEGETVRIFTGSLIPAGADHVVIQETVKRKGATAIMTRAYNTSQFIRSAGIDFHAGDILIEPGKLLSPAMLALAASANYPALQVEARPRVAILANGDELVAPGATLRPGQVIDAIRPALAAMVHRFGGTVSGSEILPDDPARIVAAIGPEADLFVTLGGASVGDHDHMREAFRQAGFDMIFDGIELKPGKPSWFARRGTQRVLGLPGNPASALVCARLLLGPLCGHPWTECTARLEEPLSANGAREHFLRAAVRRAHDGSLTARAAPSQDSSLLTPLVEYAALLRRPAGAPALAASDPVSVITEA